MGDLTDLEGPEELELHFDKVYPDFNAKRRGLQLAGIQKFRFGMSPGDRIISYNPSTREYLWGTITGDYQYNTALVPEYNNVRLVDWQHTVPRDSLSKSSKNRLAGPLTITQPAREIEAEMLAIIEGAPAPTVDIEIEADETLLESQEERSHELIKDALSHLDWDEMQELIASILRGMGYKTRVSPSGPDRGKDIIASPDGLLLEEPRIKVEVKHRTAAMGAGEIRAFLGGLRQGDRGLYVSTGGFTREAEYEAERATIPLTLVDLDRIAELLVQQYENMDTIGRALIPLTRLYWPKT
jgi:restriction system protein